MASDSKRAVSREFRSKLKTSRLSKFRQFMPFYHIDLILYSCGFLEVTLHKGLLYFDGFPLLRLVDCFWQCQLLVELKFLWQFRVYKAYQNPVSNHFISQSTKIAVCGECTRCRDECIDCLNFLAVLIELCLPENNIMANHEVVIRLCSDGVVLLQLCSTQLKGVKNIVGLISHSVD